MNPWSIKKDEGTASAERQLPGEDFSGNHFVSKVLALIVTISQRQSKSVMTKSVMTKSVMPKA